MSEVLRVHWSLPDLYLGDTHAAEYQQEKADIQFGLALLAWLKESGGGVIGPIHVTERVDPWLGGKSYQMYANTTKLPEQPAYRLMGGPADGQIVKTGGVAVFLVPIWKPTPTIAYADVQAGVTQLVAEYVRVGDTIAYMFKRMYER